MERSSGVGSGQRGPASATSPEPRCDRPGSAAFPAACTLSPDEHFRVSQSVQFLSDRLEADDEISSTATCYQRVGPCRALQSRFQMAIHRWWTADGFCAGQVDYLDSAARSLGEPAGISIMNGDPVASASWLPAVWLLPCRAGLRYRLVGRCRCFPGGPAARSEPADTPLRIADIVIGR